MSIFFDMTDKNTKFNDFKNQTISQIRIWAWAAAVLPVTALAAIFFVWALDNNTWFGYAMITGETVMFGVAVMWWWWAMYVFRNLVKHWDDTRVKVEHVLTDVRDIKSVVVEVFNSSKEDK